MGSPTGSNGIDENEPQAIEEPLRKRRHLETIDKGFLPSSDYYTIAHLCDSSIAHITLSEPTETVVTGLADGSCVFWKRSETDMVPVKRMFVHKSAILGQAADNSFKTTLATMAKDDGGALELIIWDIANIDVVRREKISDFSELTTLFYLARSDRLVGVASTDALWVLELSNDVKLHQIKKGLKNPIFKILNTANFNISIFTDGTIDYWLYASESKPYALPGPEHIDFTLRLKTQLYELKKRKILKVDFAVVDPTYKRFAVAVTQADQSGRVFVYDVRSGMIEDEMASGGPGMCFDKTGRYLYHKANDRPGLVIRDLRDKETYDGPGGGESIEQYSTLCYYAAEQEDKIPGITSAIKIGSATSVEPLMICGLQDRLIIYGTSGGDSEGEMREKISEMLVRRQQITQATSSKPMLNDLQDTSIIRDPDRAVIYTTVGDIGLTLEPSLCPKTVENFAVHAQAHYYDGTIFHRVIQDFMIQGGDPNGDGTGGVSIWGGYFKDEFNDLLNHNMPFVISMANGGPETNGSQFFITTVPCTFLNKKHTVFGHCIRGQDVVKSIESVKTNINDKPLRDIRIITIKVSKAGGKKNEALKAEELSS